MLCQTEGVEFLGDGQLDNLFQVIFGVAGAELPGVAVMSEGHLEREISVGEVDLTWVVDVVIEVVI